MRKWIKKLKENKLLLDGINVAIGLVMIIALVVLFTTESVISLFVVVWAAGLINIMNGLKMLGKKNQKMLGQSMVFMGMLIIVAGTILAFSGL